MRHNKVICVRIAWDIDNPLEVDYNIITTGIDIPTL